LIQENADHDVQTDLLGFFRRLAPDNMDWVVHTTEGPDDMPAHIKAALTQTSIGIPVRRIASRIFRVCSAGILRTVIAIPLIHIIRGYLAISSNGID
ncbi:MAG: hypothetical protein EOP84_12745, partial [Verrucomicrobiaceae bacterium]